MVKALGSGVVPCGVAGRGVGWLPEAMPRACFPMLLGKGRGPGTAHKNGQGKMVEKPMVGWKVWIGAVGFGAEARGISQRDGVGRA